MSPGDELPQILMGNSATLTAHQLYGVLRLRVDVFVVEQQCSYAELDGLDLAESTEHFWIEGAGVDDGSVAATLRVLAQGQTSRIGRVATASSHRGLGYAAVLVRAALEHLGEREITLEAQAHLEQWYAGLGFIRDGSDYVEDGICHVPMRLAR